MSETLHTVRKTKINVGGEKVHYAAFACMGSDYHRNINGARNRIERVWTQWEECVDTPRYVVALDNNSQTGKPLAPKEGDMVYNVSDVLGFDPVLSDRAFSDPTRLIPVGYLYKEGRSWKVSTTSSEVRSHILGFRNPKKIEAYTEVRYGKEERVIVKEYPSVNDEYVSYANPEFPSPVVLKTNLYLDTNLNPA
jgi:hypothetical protein